MNEFWTKAGEKISAMLIWAIDNHPGKLIGTTVGFFVGLLIVTLGLWHTLVLALFVFLGFVLGKSQDEHNILTEWIDRFINKH